MIPTAGQHYVHALLVGELRRYLLHMPVKNKNLILFYCGLRTAHFGQGTFIDSLLPLFKNRDDLILTIIKTDCPDISTISHGYEDGMEMVSVPPLQRGAILTGDNSILQKAQAQRLIGIIYPYLKNKNPLLFWVNSIDYLNLTCELKNVFKDCKLMYVHHSFSWKYFINVPDEIFANEWKKKNYSFHPKAFEMTRYQKDLATISDVVITVTDHARNFLIKVLDVPAKKIHTIYDGISPPLLKKGRKQELRKIYGFQRTDKVILYSGRIAKDKGFLDLLKAFKLVADKNNKSRLVILGLGQILKDIPIVYPHWSKITYTGDVQRSVVSDFYNLADIGVIPSLHEQCSFTAIEMRLHKLPVIVSAVDGLDELFTHGQDSLKITVHHNESGERTINDEELETYLQRLLFDREFADLLAKNSYKKALKMFTIDIMWKNYESVIQNLFH